MIIEGAVDFMLEGNISEVFSKGMPYQCLGYLVIHLQDFQYGVRANDATMMGCSYDRVCELIHTKGTRNVQGLEHRPPLYIAMQRLADYVDDGIGLPVNNDGLATQVDWTNWRKCIWAPDGDEAFDDSSYVMQFDVGDQVRLVGFRHGEPAGTVEPGSLRQLWLSADDFYGALARWRAAFEALWMSMPKTIETWE